MDNVEHIDVIAPFGCPMICESAETRSSISKKIRVFVFVPSNNIQGANKLGQLWANGEINMNAIKDFQISEKPNGLLIGYITAQTYNTDFQNIARILKERLKNKYSKSHIDDNDEYGFIFRFL